MGRGWILSCGFGPQDGLENWVELVKAWDGLHSIAQTLKEFHWALAPGQFLQLVEGLLDSYLIRPKRVFAQRVLVLSTRTSWAPVHISISM